MAIKRVILNDSVEAVVSHTILKDLCWMARRYCDGRSSYAPSMFNNIVDGLIAAGVPIEPVNEDEGIYAKDGMFGVWDPALRRFVKEGGGTHG